LVCTRPADRTAPSSAIATSQNSKCTSKPTVLWPHPTPSTRSTGLGDAVGKRHRRIRAQSATGQVAGAATEKPGLKRPSSNNRPAQHAFSQEPLSRSPDPNGRAPHSSPGRHFHAPRCARLGQRARNACFH
jgi:hypothetical protein